MRFTEHEMTVAVDAVARRLFAASRPPWRRGGAEAAWYALAPIEKYHRRSAVGEIVLPALHALPERATPGVRHTFDDAEYADAAEVASRALSEHRTPGAWARMPQRRRRRLVRTTEALTRTAVAAMPVRREPGETSVPDDL